MEEPKNIDQRLATIDGGCSSNPTQPQDAINRGDQFKLADRKGRNASGFLLGVEAFQKIHLAATLEIRRIR